MASGTALKVRIAHGVAALLGLALLTLYGEAKIKVGHLAGAGSVGRWLGRAMRDWAKMDTVV